MREGRARALVARAAPRGMNQWTRQSYELFDSAVDRARSTPRPRARASMRSRRCTGMCAPMKGTRLREQPARGERSPPRNVDPL